MEYLYFALNISVAMLIGSALGLERQYGGHPAGLRTNALVSLGAAMFVSVSHLFHGVPGVDPTRITSYVVSGIGFLGGGVILREGLTVRGLNTAATLWCSAAVGVMCGLGFLLHALVGAFLVLLINLLLRPLALWIDSNRTLAPDIETCYRIRIVCAEQDHALIRSILMRHINSQSKMTVHGIATQEADQTGRAAVSAEVYSLVSNDHAMDELVSRLNIEPSVVAISWEKKH